MIKGYLGSYNESKSEGMYTFEYNRGKFTNNKLFAQVKNCKYIQHINDKIYSIFEEEIGAGVCVLSLQGQVMGKLFYEESTSCYIHVDGEDIYTTNFTLGTVTKLRYSGGKLQVIKHLKVKEKAGCHQVILWEDRVCLPCLNLDKILVLDKELTIIDEIVFPKGSGPRHGVVCNGNMYIACENSCELYRISLSNKSSEMKENISLLPKDTINKGGTAAIREQDGFIYISTRGINIITVVDIKDGMKVVQIKEIEGDHPRDIYIRDNLLLVANRYSNELIAYNVKDGRIMELMDSIKVPAVVTIAL